MWRYSASTLWPHFQPAKPYMRPSLRTVWATALSRTFFVWQLRDPGAVVGYAHRVCTTSELVAEGFVPHLATRSADADCRATASKMTPAILATDDRSGHTPATAPSTIPFEP